MNKLHLTTLYAIIVAIAPFLLWADGYIAHASDVERTNAQIMLEVRQMGIDNRMGYNEIRSKIYENNDEERHLLREERLMLMRQQSVLDSLRQDIK